MNISRDRHSESQVSSRTFAETSRVLATRPAVRVGARSHQLSNTFSIILHGRRCTIILQVSAGLRGWEEHQEDVEPCIWFAVEYIFF